MGNLYFLRHCKTQFNADGMISGCLDSELIENEITYQELASKNSRPNCTAIKKQAD